MDVRITEEPIDTLPEYAVIPIAFEVNRIFSVTIQNEPVSEIILSEQVLPLPRVKDYDSIVGNRPIDWPRRFNVAHWGLLVARTDGQRVGGAVIAFSSPDVEMLERRPDVSQLWDFRVDPKLRRRGIGSALFRGVEIWAMRHGCRQLTIETQNTNVPACRFYARQGCALKAANISAYPTLPDEVQLLWYKDLPSLALV